MTEKLKAKETMMTTTVERVTLTAAKTGAVEMVDTRRTMTR